jgi:hypothetical protein
MQNQPQSLPELPPMKAAENPPIPSMPPMNHGPEPGRGFAAPSGARAVGSRRLRQAVTTLAGGGFALVLLVGGLELVARPGLRPSDLMATIEARTELGIMNQKLGGEPGVMNITEADYQEAIAKAQREGQAQAELAFQRELAGVQRVVAAYQTLYSRANMIAQAALQLETMAQQMRAQLLQASNGGRNMVIMFKDIFCGLGDPDACQSARADRGTMIAEADELSRGDVGKRVRELLAGTEDPASLITREDRRNNGTPSIER